MILDNEFIGDFRVEVIGLLINYCLKVL